MASSLENLPDNFRSSALISSLVAELGVLKEDFFLESLVGVAFLLLVATLSELLLVSTCPRISPGSTREGDQLAAILSFLALYMGVAGWDF